MFLLLAAMDSTGQSNVQLSGVEKLELFELEDDLTDLDDRLNVGEILYVTSNSFGMRG